LISLPFLRPRVIVNLTIMVSSLTSSEDLEMQKSPLSFSPYEKFMYALNSRESKRQYPKRLQMFLDFINIRSNSIEENCNLFYKMVKEKKDGISWVENELFRFFALQNKRVERGEISTETIKNYFKPIKRFCEMNRIILNWKIISSGIKKGIRYSNDRPPSMDEIRKLIQYPDRRIKPIVLVMISSGIRVSSWSYLKWGDFTPIYTNDILIAAKLKVFNTKTKNYYYSYVTPEAYQSVKDWINFRESFGEKIDPDSWVIRNLWQIKSQRYGNYLGLAKHPKKLSATGIRVLINDAWKIQGLREKRMPKEGEFNYRKYDFKSVHGFRKLFETECQKVMRELIVSMLMSHDTGIVQHYLRPKEEDILAEYQKAIPLLTIDQDENSLNEKLSELQEQNKTSVYVIKGKLQEKEEQIHALIKKQEQFEQVIQSFIDSGQLKPKIL
jgi:integrase